MEIGRSAQNNKRIIPIVLRDVEPLAYIQFDTLAWISKFDPSGAMLIAADANRIWLLDAKQFDQFRNATNGKLCSWI